MLEPSSDEKADAPSEATQQEVITETHDQHEEVAAMLQLPYTAQQDQQHEHNNVAAVAAAAAIPRLIPHVQVAPTAVGEISALTTQQIEADGGVVFISQAAATGGGGSAESGGAAAQVVTSSQGVDDVTVVTRNVVTSAAASQPQLLPAITPMSVGQGQGQQFYLMVPAGSHEAPQVITQNATQRAIAPRAQQAGGKQSVSRSMRDERRRSTHNEVERRRRDKINTWITELAKVVPDCQEDHTKQGQSKGGVLAKTVDYIQDLQQAHARMSEIAQSHERLSMDAQALQTRIVELEHENTALKAKLQSMESQMLQNRVEELEMENATLKAQYSANQTSKIASSEDSAMNTS